MVSSAVKAARATAKALGKEYPHIFGVTLLSSFGQRTLTEELCVEKNIEDYVIQLVQLAKECELDGVLASADEAKRIRKLFGDELTIICPATRPTWSVVNDQVRVVTPKEAILAGVDYIVIGRPIIEAENRKVAAQLVIDEIASALEEKALPV